ncbi:hypothetical protein [uncultured Bradyrhizobium sp.]|uniref:hypothetical protein n=1 Tax=uncultured Bradyrhizobium sp. TaxID=199684 RepID=UPI0035C9E922
MAVGAGNTGSTTTGSTTTGSATTGSASTVARPVRSYENEAAELRLKAVISDLRFDARTSIGELNDYAANLRGQARNALQRAIDFIARTQDRTEILSDVGRDLIGQRDNALRTNKDDKAARSGSAAASESLTTGQVNSKENSSFDLGTMVAVLGFAITAMVAWFGDNLGERKFGRKPGSKPALVQTEPPTGTAAG